MPGAAGATAQASLIAVATAWCVRLSANTVTAQGLAILGAALQAMRRYPSGTPAVSQGLRKSTAVETAV